MIRKFLLIAVLITNLMYAMATQHDLRVIYTTDVHGNFLPYNFITRTPGNGSLARVSTYVDSLRNTLGHDKVILLDNGDILQGQPTAYYYNFIDTVTPHIVSRIYDYMGYDATSIGNHDIETGHSVYDRYSKQTHVPVLSANTILTATGKPYFPPYKIIERNGIRIAIVGMLTPAIPAWLPENLWSGLRFDDIVETAKTLIPIILKNEHPDIVIGLFHSGADPATDTSGYHENASITVAQQVPGFDAILMGHDHRVHSSVVKAPDSAEIPVLNPANDAKNIGELNIVVEKDDNGNILKKSVSGKIVNIETLSPSQEFMAQFSKDITAINNYVNREIGYITDSITTRDAFFGASPFMNLIHKLQLDISGADISFAAPLSFDASIKKGKIRMSDMFTLYKYENMLYTVNLTGEEIKNYLEMSYALWTQQITDSNSHIINFADEKPDSTHNRLKKPSYNFDSAYGIDYTVDVTKPEGQKVNITSLSNGKPFDMNKTYTVAVNSYRGNGGGDLLTIGAGIAKENLGSRIVKSTDKDLRYYLMKQIETIGTIVPDSSANWQFVPESIATPILNKDRHILFSGKGSEKQK